MCETANQQSISSHMVVYMACKMRCRWLTFRRCFVNRALSRNRSLRDAKPARHIFVWFAKHCLAEHCLSFRGDADECEKQFCFVFRICLAFFDSRLWRPLLEKLPNRRVIRRKIRSCDCAIRISSSHLGSQKTDSGVCIISSGQLSITFAYAKGTVRYTG